MVHLLESSRSTTALVGFCLKGVPVYKLIALGLLTILVALGCGQTAEDLAKDAEDRTKGFHCLSKLDGNHDGLEALIRERLNDPGSMETIETRIAAANAQGDHRIELDFTAKNAFGGRVRNTAHGWVSQSTCVATLTLIE